MPTYPTKKQILASEPHYKVGLTELVMGWKSTTYSKLKNTKIGKQAAIHELVKRIAHLYSAEVKILEGDRDCYVPAFKTIYLSEKVSIITALHELAHALDYQQKIERQENNIELTACRWSVHLFKACFPRSYARLTWKGHQLVRSPR